MTDNAIGKNLYRLRLGREWSQQRVCEELEKYGVFISRSTYTKYETGGRHPSAETVAKLALCFETTTDYILGLTDKE